jgi:predicted nucleotidyltransferase
MHTSLEHIFGSRIRAKLIGLLFTNPDDEFVASRLSELLDEKTSCLSRELSRMVRTGILVSGRRKKLKTFRANRSYVFFPELHGLALRTVGVDGQLIDAFSRLNGVRHAFVYGPYTRGDCGNNDDIDLLIIGDAIDGNRLDELMEGVEKRVGRALNYIVYACAEFEAKVKARNAFLMDVLDDDLIMLAGRREGLPSRTG